MDNDDVIAADALPATKGDLRALRAELKADIAGCAAKADLAGFATKADLERFATKEDLLMFREDLVHQIAVSAARLETRVDGKIDRLLGAFADFRSDIVRIVERSVDQGNLNERGLTLLGHRVDELDKRVTRLESKPERPA